VRVCHISATLNNANIICSGQNPPPQFYTGDSNGEFYHELLTFSAKVQYDPARNSPTCLVSENYRKTVRPESIILAGSNGVTSQCHGVLQPYYLFDYVFEC